MLLDTFSYIEHPNDERYWELTEFKLNDINLIVGNNSSGKTRTLNVISGLSNLLTNPRIPFGNGYYRANFIDEEKNKIRYIVDISNGRIDKEELFHNDEKLIERDKTGSGYIRGIEIKQDLKIKIPYNELAALRRDDIQFPYLNKLYNWAIQLRHFRFAKEHEKNTLAVVNSNKPKTEEFNLKETDKSIQIFSRGIEKYEKKFANKIIEDFNTIGYSIEKIELGK